MSCELVKQSNQLTIVSTAESLIQRAMRKNMATGKQSYARLRQTLFVKSPSGLFVTQYSLGSKNVKTGYNKLLHYN